MGSESNLQLRGSIEHQLTVPPHDRCINDSRGCLCNAQMFPYELQFERSFGWAGIK
jgi:hypothetical protein